MAPFEEDNGLWLGSGCFLFVTMEQTSELPPCCERREAEGKPRVRGKREPCPTGRGPLWQTVMGPTKRGDWALWRLVEVPRGRQPRTFRSP